MLCYTILYYTQLLHNYHSYTTILYYTLLYYTTTILYSTILQTVPLGMGSGNGGGGLPYRTQQLMGNLTERAIQGFTEGRQYAHRIGDTLGQLYYHNTNNNNNTGVQLPQWLGSIRQLNTSSMKYNTLYHQADTAIKGVAELGARQAKGWIDFSERQVRSFRGSAPDVHKSEEVNTINNNIKKERIPEIMSAETIKQTEELLRT